MLLTRRNTRAFTLVELTIASGVFVLLSAGIAMCFSIMNRSLTMAQQYALGKMTLTDYIAMDLRRSQIDFPKCGIANPPTSNTFTLPLVLKQPDILTSTNKPGTLPTYATIVAGTVQKDQQKLTSSDYILPYRYNTATGTSLPRYVTYYLSGTNLCRKEEAYNTATPAVLTKVSDRVIANGVADVTFSSDEITVGATLSTLVVSDLNYQVSFTKSSASKAASTLVGGTANQTILYNETFLRYATYGPPLPTHP